MITQSSQKVPAHNFSPRNIALRFRPQKLELDWVLSTRLALLGCVCVCVLFPVKHSVCVSPYAPARSGLPPTLGLGHLFLFPGWNQPSEYLYRPSCSCCCCHPQRSMSPHMWSRPSPPGPPLEGQGTPPRGCGAADALAMANRGYKGI